VVSPTLVLPTGFLSCRIPEIRQFLENISPLNNASKITDLLSVAHGETDSRVTVEEGIRMRNVVKNGVYIELMVCENEGHGKSSILNHV